MSSVHEQLQNQRELARLQRLRHGADTTLDDAERRHDAIKQYLWNARLGVPILFALTLSWIGSTVGPQAWAISVLVVVAASVVARWLGSFVNWITGPFAPMLWDKFETAIMLVTGFCLMGGGMGIGGLGMALTGIVMMIWPFVWPRWNRHVITNTDYARHSAATRAPQTAPRIIE